jgi:hypothetical protein
MNIDRKDFYSVKSILSILRTGVDSVILDGDEIRLTSLKYKMFLEKGVDCVQCGIVGMFFVKERDKADKREKDQVYYLRLYGLTPDGEEVLITKDHIQPKSRGGADAVENLQTMCVKCNHGKGNKFGQEDEQYLDGRANFIS